jgi:bifunctional DNase/RNase
MKKVLVNVLGLSYSQTQSGAYAVVLSEPKGNRKLPIIVNSTDAQTIALRLEGIKTQRPLTHDLFKSFTEVFNADLVEVSIYSLVEGIFMTKLVFNDGVQDIELDCTIGDGIALAMIYQSPIYVAEFVISSAGIVVDEDDVARYEDGEDVDDAEIIEEKPRRSTVEELEIMLQKALDDEQYEVAAQVRDKINSLKENR